MDTVIVMVGRNNESVIDIEVMPDIPAKELVEAIRLALGWSGTFELHVNGKRLENHQTLADVEAWDGSEIILFDLDPAPDLNGYKVVQLTETISDTQAARRHRLVLPDAGISNPTLNTAEGPTADTPQSPPPPYPNSLPKTGKLPEPIRLDIEEDEIEE